MHRVLERSSRSMGRGVLCASLALFVALGAVINIRAGAAVQAPDDPQYPQQWNLAKVRAPEAWNITTGSAAVKVALLDSGVGYTGIPVDLQGRIGASYNTFTGGTTVPDDLGTLGSGTSNAGIIGARTNNSVGVAGLNWNITILPVKVCNWTGECPAANVAQGINWAVAQGAQVIQVTPTSTSTTAALNDAVARAVGAGRLIVAPVASPGTGIGYPGLLPGVITVGATNSSDVVTAWSAGGPQLDLVAPAEAVPAIVSGGCCSTRTAPGLAAAHVSGALALMLAAGVAPMFADDHLLEGAKDLGAPGWDAQSGWGRLDICEAFTRAGMPCAEPQCVDLDGNGYIDLADIVALIGHFGATGSNLLWDIDGDGGVGVADSVLLLGCAFEN